MGDLQIFQLCPDGLQVTIGRLQETRGIRSRIKVGIFEQPSRHAAESLFRTNIRARAHDHPHAFFLADSDEFGDVQVAREIEFVRHLFMRIPEDVGADTIKAHGLGLLDTITPVGTRHPWVMNRS